MVFDSAEEAGSRREEFLAAHRATSGLRWDLSSEVREGHLLSLSERVLVHPRLSFTGEKGISIPGLGKHYHHLCLILAFGDTSGTVKNCCDP